MQRKKMEFQHSELEELADQIGNFIQYWGFKKIHGRIWAHIFLSPDPLDATTLVRRLRVSKALISFSIRDLLKFDVLHEVSRGRGRTIFYCSNPQISQVVVNVLRLRERKMLSQVLHATVNLEGALGTFKDIPVDLARLKDLAQMAKSAQDTLDLLIRSGAEKQSLFEEILS